MKAAEIIAKYGLDNKSFTHKGFHAILHFYFPVGEMPIRPLLDYYGDCHRLVVYFIHDNYADWYWNDEDMTRLRKSFIQKVNENPRQLSTLLTDWKKRLRSFETVMAKLNSTDLSKLSNDQLVNVYEKWYASYISQYALAIGFQDPFSMHAENFLLPHFRRIISEKGMANQFNEVYASLLCPVEDSFLTREYKDRLKILDEWKMKDFRLTEKVRKALKDHSKKYHWIQNNYAKVTYLDEHYFLKQLQSMKSIDPKNEIKKLANDQKSSIERKKKLIRELSLDNESLNLIRITEVFAYMQDERKKYVLLANYYQDIFLGEFQKRLNMMRESMEYTYIHELKALLRQKSIDQSVFEQRKKGVLVINNLDGYEIIAGPAAEEVFHSVFMKKQEGQGIIRGITASPGKARGIVRIVKKIHDLINIDEGDILVASMTRPEMIVGMKRAAAIVTDEGGITSHAAVVSRELKKPCIIGTKSATSVLKDGDIVEVDADKGTVRKILQE